MEPAPEPEPEPDGGGGDENAADELDVNDLMADMLGAVAVAIDGQAQGGPRAVVAARRKQRELEEAQAAAAAAAAADASGSAEAQAAADKESGGGKPSRATVERSGTAASGYAAQATRAVSPPAES